MNPDLEWQRRYEQNDTPWDKGKAAPALVAFLPRGQITNRVLVPGCGKGHEARALAADTHVTSVVGLDISPLAVAQTRELSAQTSSQEKLSFVEADFFHLPMNLRESFDWIVEHTCFCAIEPNQRKYYVLAASSALRAGGKIFAIFYLNPDTDSGPPFAVTREELSALFDPHFSLVDEWVPQEAFPGRENRELVRILQKR